MSRSAHIDDGSTEELIFLYFLAIDSGNVAP